MYFVDITVTEPFSILIKPASFDCNLRCSYCFYLPKETLFGPPPHRMTTDTLEAVTRAYLAVPMPEYLFCWQGGEPTLMGIPFFQNAVRLQRLHRPRRAVVRNALQTNGTLLDDHWADFLHREQFLVGLSLDGPPALHDACRRRPDGAGSHDLALRGLRTLQQHRVEHNVLTLVSKANQDAPEDIYHYLKSLGVTFHQYIECADRDPDGNRLPYALEPGKWGEFLCRLFDAWYPNDTRTVSIRLFDAILNRLVTGQTTLCAMAASCCAYLVVEHDGSVYPCDFCVAEAARLGNVRQTRLTTLRNHPHYRDWGRQKAPCSPRCHACRWLPLCLGDCQRHRAPDGRSILCDDWQLFFQHTIERFENLAATLST